MRKQVDVSDRLAGKLNALSDGLDRYERFGLHLLMSVSIGGVAPHGAAPRRRRRAEAWKTGLKVLAHINPSGLPYVGRPSFVDKRLLSGLLCEAREKESVAHRTGPQEISPGGRHAIALSRSQELRELVSRALGVAVRSTGITTYLYYNRTGDHLFPHVDTEIFSINCIVMLEHVIPRRARSRSALVTYGLDGRGRRVPLRPGEIAVLQASGTAHARESVRESERVTLLTIGFNRLRSR